MGGYPGEIAVLPYYLKIKEYSDVESRDIWEYKLNLSREEVQQLVRHIWEIQLMRFDYFFFTENCAYRLLAMINILRPNDRLLDEYNLYTIPVDTVRQVVEKGMVEEISYRPSVIRRFKHQLSQLDDQKKAFVLQLTEGLKVDFDSLSLLAEGQKKNLLDVAFQYSRVMPDEEGEAAKISFDLLKARQALPGKSSLSPIAQPEFSDDAGHLSGRMSLGLGRRQDSDYIDFQIRPAYHDLIDPALGYPEGSELNFFSTTLGYTKSDQWYLSELDLIRIQSIKPRDQFFSPTSWAVNLGLGRFALGEEAFLVGHIEGQLGPAYQVGSLLVYGLFGGEFQIDEDLYRGHDVLAKTNFGVLSRFTQGQLQVDLQARDTVTSNLPLEYTLSSALVFNVSDDWSLKLFHECVKQDSNYYQSNYHQSNYRHSYYLSANLYF